MDAKRKGEIALAILRRQARQEGLRLSSIHREIGNISKDTEIPPDELSEFMREEVQMMVDETFPRR
jgi:hypothetical protein